MAYTQYTHNDEIVELELVDDGGAVIRNPKNHNDTRRISKEDFQKNYKVQGESQEEKDKADFDKRLKAAQQDEPKPAPARPAARQVEEAPKRKEIPDTQSPLRNPDRNT